MIVSFRHRVLRRLYEEDDRRGVNPEHTDKLRRVPAQLNRSSWPDDMDLPGFRLHPMKGDLAGFWAVTVRANWRGMSRLVLKCPAGAAELRD
jgi:proteic killer suppression protein